MKKITFQLFIAFITFFGSKKQISALSKIAGFDEWRTFRVVKKARVWIVMAIIFAVPFFFWACLAFRVMFQWDTPFVTETGEPFTTHFQWLWWNLKSNDAFAVSVIGAFPLKALLGIEWICWNKFSWERSFNKGYYSELNRSSKELLH